MIIIINYHCETQSNKNEHNDDHSLVFHSLFNSGNNSKIRRE